MTSKIKPAKKYKHTDDLWIISCFFNPNFYRTKPRNFEVFIDRIESSNLNFLIVECVFGKQPFSLRKSAKIIRVKTTDVMWQKERLLNIALQNLPNRCKKIAWVDCDVLFENPDWASETAAQLRHCKVIQPFKEAIRLPKNVLYYSGEGERYYSFAYVVKKNPCIIEEGRFDLHGHTGFAWASHKSILQKYGFYDACIAGSGDHMMAHAFAGDWTTKCIERVIGKNERFHSHYIDWSKKIYPQVKASINYVDGTLLHLWHGDVGNRNYVIRQRTLEKVQFDPTRDIALNKIGCWVWNHKKRGLKAWAKDYFALRREDE
jgi:hypothetical protein